MTKYEKLLDRVANGWNTWYVKSMLAYILLPEGMVYNLGIKEYRGGQHIREALKGPLT